MGLGGLSECRKLVCTINVSEIALLSPADFNKHCDAITVRRWR